MAQQQPFQFAYQPEAMHFMPTVKYDIESEQPANEQDLKELLDFQIAPMVQFESFMNPPSPPGSPMISLDNFRARSDSLTSWTSNMSNMNYLPPQPRMAQRSMSLPMIMQPMDFQHNSMLFPITEAQKFEYQQSFDTSSTGSQDKLFRCTHPGCDRTFTRVQNLRSHSRCHLPTAPHICKTCGMGFRRTTDLQRHIRTMHTPNDQKPWGCTKCGKRFGRSDALKRHMASRSKEHGCPGGPNLELLAKMEEAKKQRELKQQMMNSV